MTITLMIRQSFLPATALLLISSLFNVTAQAIDLPDGFIDEAFVGELGSDVVSFDASAQARLFVAEKSGIVRVVFNGFLQPEPFIDISDIVNDRVDRGLLSLAVHPQFPQVPYIYVLYTYDPPELLDGSLTGAAALDGNGNRVARLARYTADETRDFNVALAGSEEIILGKNSTFETIGNPEGQFDTTMPSCGPIGTPIVDCLPADEVTHTIGSLRFAADGSLFVTNGDGANYRSTSPLSQMTYDLNSMRGKLLRIDPDTGLGLPDNPFYDGDPASNRSRVASYGLRNPYSMSVNPVSGVPYVGEVGEETWEEINAGIGHNFGWPCYEGGSEGTLRQPDFEVEPFCQEVYLANEPVEPPLISWSHDGSGNAVILGDFYFGEAFPEEFNGTLFFGDLIKGWLRYADVSEPGNVVVKDFATNMQAMVEMRTGVDGALYYASFGSGEIRRSGSDTGSGSGADSGSEADTGAEADTGSETETSNEDELNDGGLNPPANDDQQSEPSTVNVGGQLAIWSCLYLAGFFLLRRSLTKPRSRRNIR